MCDTHPSLLIYSIPLSLLLLNSCLDPEGHRHSWFSLGLHVHACLTARQVVDSIWTSRSLCFPVCRPVRAEFPLGWAGHVWPFYSFHKKNPPPLPFKHINTSPNDRCQAELLEAKSGFQVNTDLTFQMLLCYVNGGRKTNLIVFFGICNLCRVLEPFSRWEIGALTSGTNPRKTTWTGAVQVETHQREATYTSLEIHSANASPKPSTYKKIYVDG